VSPPRRPNRGRAPARERLLAAEADEHAVLREGVQSVGIDRIMKHAGVARPRCTTCSGAKQALG